MQLRALKDAFKSIHEYILLVFYKLSAGTAEYGSPAEQLLLPSPVYRWHIAKAQNKNLLYLYIVNVSSFGFCFYAYFILTKSHLVL